MATPKGTAREAGPGQMEGMVIKIVSDFFTVRSPSGSLECRRRGRLDLYGDGGGIMVGDRVRVLELGVGKGMIEERFPRRNGL
ncbi:MAG: ribosome small subunit-dependent GTPase, partial [Firmicutes bacterium]|nr:ribosome small subunit-dependent GTPase [Bacillota bacterium]